MSEAIAGVGTQFRRWNPTSASWVTISEINSITGPGMSRDVIDVTSLDSTSGYREFITGFRNAGTLTLSMNFSRTEYELMKEDFESDIAVNYEIMLPDDENTSLEFSGLVTECPLTIPPDDKVTVDITIQISGEVTMNSGSGSGS